MRVLLESTTQWIPTPSWVDGLKEDPQWPVYDKSEWIQNPNGGDRPNITPLFANFPLLVMWPVG